MRIATWNILHGGGPARTPEIALALVSHAPDLLLLTEFRAARGGQLRGVLADHGLTHHLTSQAAPEANALLLASRAPLDRLAPRADADFEPARLLVARERQAGLVLLGVHIPPDPASRARHWTRLVDEARRWSAGPALVLGDLNAGRRDLDGPGDFCRQAPFLGALATMGYADAWRIRHPGERQASWVSRSGRGFRLDHALVSPSLARRVADARYSHSERDLRLSDHSLLVLTLAPSGADEPAPAPAPGGPAPPCDRRTPE